MVRKGISISFLLIMLYPALCFADRQLERSEILLLFDRLTSEPRNTWISAGTVEASHQEYRAAKVIDEDKIRAAISENMAKYLANSNKPEQTENLQKLQLDAIPFNTRYELSNEYTMNSTESAKYDGQRFKRRIDKQCVYLKILLVMKADFGSMDNNVSNFFKGIGRSWLTHSMFERFHQHVIGQI